MKKSLAKLLPEYFGKCVQIKKTDSGLANLSVEIGGIQMKETGTRKKYSEKFIDSDNACNLEDIMSDIVSNTYKHVEVFFLLKTKEGQYLILRHFKSLKKDFYFAINIMPKEEFKKDKAMKEAVFFFKKK